MKLRYSYLIGLCSLLLSVFVLMTSGSPLAQEVLRYSCSAQVYEAFENERLDAFTKKTGIKVELSVFPSYKAFFRLMNGHSDIASMACDLYRRHREAGFVETLFCKDPMAIIVNARCPITNLTETQLRDIFGGTIINWKEVGGPDRPIIVILPGEETAAHRNFGRKVMLGGEMVFDVMTAKSTMVIEATRCFPDSISFIAHGAARYCREMIKKCQEEIKISKIRGLSPGDPDYPYYQVFSFVTKGRPTGVTEKFIDFAFSEEAKRMCVNRGCIPLPR
jgi:phosphate transport system substrate-binding protein